MGAYNIVQPGGYAVAGMKLRINYFCAWQDQIGMFGVGSYVTSQTATGARLGEIAKVKADDVKALIVTLQASDVTFLGVKVSQVFAAPPVLPGIASGADVGTAGTITLPGQLSLIYTHQTAVSGRGFRGRSYVPFPSSDYVDGSNFPIAGVLPILQNLANISSTFETILGADGNSVIEPVVLHKAGTFTGIINYIPRRRFAGQRRRGSYGQLNAPIIP